MSEKRPIITAEEGLDILLMIGIAAAATLLSVVVYGSENSTNTQQTEQPQVEETYENGD